MGVRANDLLFLLTACVATAGCVAEDVPSEAADAVHFRNGSPAIVAESLSGEFACFRLQHGCTAPEEVQVEVDGQTVLDWTPASSHRCFEASDEGPPRTYCHPTSGLATGAHTFELTSTCGGTAASASLSASPTPPAYRFASITPDKPTYTRGDAIEIVVDATAAGLLVSADFSAVDTEYVTGAETVTALGGGKYKIRYVTSTSNRRPAGDYNVPVSIGTVAAAKLHDVSIRWLPRGFPRVSPVGGEFNPGAAPSRSADSTLNHVVTIAASATQPAGADPALFSTSQTDDGPGKAFTFTFASNTPIPDTIRVEMQDTVRDGLFTTNYSVAEQGVVGGATVYSISGRLQGDPLQPSATVRFRLVHADGTASAWFSKSFDFAWPGAIGEVLVKGTLRYQYQSCSPDTSPTGVLEESPLRVKATCPDAVLPARRIMIEVTNDCGQSHRDYVKEDGSFLLWLPDTCAEQEFRVVAHSVTRPGNGNRIAVGKWKTLPYPSLISQFTANPADYATHSFTVATFDPPFGNSTTDVGSLLLLASPIEGTEQANMAKSAHIIDYMARGIDYFGNFIDPGEFSPLNVAWEIDIPDLEDGFPTYVPSVHPAFWYLPAKGAGRFHTTHELAHYIHRFFLDSGPDYGRFSEPMAHANACAISKLCWLDRFTRNDFENLDFNGDFAADIGGPGVDGFRQSDLLYFADNASYQTCANRMGCCSVDLDDQPLCVMGSNGWIWRILNDLHDGTGLEPASVFWLADGSGMTPDFGNFDEIDGRGASGEPTNHELSDVLFNYLGGAAIGENPARDDRGLANRDLVDTLDGMVCRGHLTESAVTKLLWDAMDFDYDPDGAPASCP